MRRLLRFAVLVFFAIVAFAPSPGAEVEAVFTTIVAEPLISPRPVDGADGRTHMAYELLLVNGTSLVTQIDSITAFDAATGVTLGEWKGDALAAVLRLNAHLPGVTLGPARSAYAFLDATVPRGAPLPKTIRHRISVTRLMASADGEHQPVPLDPKIGIASHATFEGVDVAVNPHRAVVIAPPLRGSGWVDFNGCCGSLQHRGSVMAFNGKPIIAERFAIDFIKLDAERRLFVGPIENNENYPTYGVPVYAVADGKVIEATDGAPERIPSKPREPVTIENAAGNHIVLDIGDGNFVLFAHLKTGTVAVKPGDRVKAGAVIARAGDTGNSDAPHLHFHVMDGASPLSSNGVPYVFTKFAGAGQLTSKNDDLFEKGGPADIDSSWHAGPHMAELPLDGEVIDFP
ncbi:MAG: M23 family metallopeptidase [Acidobacteriaceae bacterium]|jgi:peptidase M23-like protein